MLGKEKPLSLTEVVEGLIVSAQNLITTNIALNMLLETKKRPFLAKVKQNSTDRLALRQISARQENNLANNKQAAEDIETYREILKLPKKKD